VDHRLISSVVKKIFPEGTEFCLDGNIDLSESQFWIIPGKKGEPRWILPHDREYGWPFLQEWYPYDFSSRLKWHCLMAAYRGKGLRYVPGVVPLKVIVPEKSNWEHLGWYSINQPVPVIYVGSPGRSRKAVLGLIDSQERKVASIGKVPLGPSAGLAINREVDILEDLAKEKPGRAPRTLFVDRGNGISVQEFFSGSPTGRHLTERHVEFLADLVIPGETISLREVAEDLERQINTLEDIDPKARTVLERVLEEIDDPSPLSAVWEHGDFTPWNIKKVTNGSLRTVDWEASSRRRLPLFDLIFFQTMQVFLFGENELFPKPFRRTLNRYVDRLNISPAMTKKVAKACITLDWLKWRKAGKDSLRTNFLFHTLARPMGGLM
jgi:hypothetical protein